VLYRRHGANVTGLARGPGLAAALRGLPGAAARTPDVRRWLARIAGQASAFLERYGDRLDAPSRRRLERLAGIPSCGALERKRRIVEAFWGSGRGWLHTVGWAIRG
jgi:hypothetical protein